MWTEMAQQMRPHDKSATLARGGNTCFVGSMAIDRGVEADRAMVVPGHRSRSRRPEYRSPESERAHGWLHASKATRYRARRVDRGQSERLSRPARGGGSSVLGRVEDERHAHANDAADDGGGHDVGKVVLVGGNA
jgi:hypothetical protein